MPKYKYALKNGKTLVLEGDTQPDDAEVEQIAKAQGVELVPADSPFHPPRALHPEAKIGAAPDQPSAGSRFLSNLASGLSGIVTGPAMAILHPVDTYNGLVDQSARNFAEAKDLYDKGEYGHAAHHAIAGVIPPYSGVTDAADKLRAGDTAGAMGQAVAAGVAPEVARGTGAVLRKAAPAIMDFSLGRTSAQRAEFPNTPRRMVDERILPSKAGQKLTETENRINATAQQYDAQHPILAKTGFSGQHANPGAMADAAKDFAVKEGKVDALGNIPGSEMDEIDDLHQNYLDQNTRPRGLLETIAQKRAYQARTNYNNRPNAPVQTNNEINFNKGIAAENRAAAISMEPSLEGELAREQDLIGAKTAKEMRDNRGMPYSGFGAGKKFLMDLGLGPMLSGGSILTNDVGRLLLRPDVQRMLLLSALQRRIQPVGDGDIQRPE